MCELNVYIYIYKFINQLMRYIYIYIYIYIITHIHIWRETKRRDKLVEYNSITYYILWYICVCVHVYVYIFVYVCVCVRVCVLYIHINSYIYIYIYIFIPRCVLWRRIRGLRGRALTLRLINGDRAEAKRGLGAQTRPGPGSAPG